MAGKMLASRMATGTAVLLAGALLTTAVPSALAHTSSAAPTISAVAETVVPAVPARVELLSATPATTVPVWFALLALALLASLIRAPRRVAVGVVVVLIAILAFETGVHAVHHLGDRHAASHCAVASVAPQLGGTADAPSTAIPHLHVTAHAVVLAEPVVLSARPVGPAPVRAPPSLAS
jgi:hypothetical protein